jgi:AcrR family transcriptional regulator
MSEKHISGTATRQRVLDVACELFASVGYEQTTLMQIAEHAKANKVAVNYYFRSKEALYQECWRLVLQRSLEAHPPDGGVAADAPAEERLRGWIHSLLARMAPSNREFQLVIREVLRPTGLLSEIVRESIEPLQAGLAAVIGELLGPKATNLHLVLCIRSITGQCMDLMVLEHLHAAVSTTARIQEPADQNTDFELAVDHITRFSLAGIRETRKYLEAAASSAGR